MTEQQLLVDCLTRLNRVAVTYMLTGSMASNFWGIPRSTHDLDFVVAIPPAATSQLVAAFRDGFFLDEEAVRAATQPPHQFNAIDRRSSLKVDFWMLGDSPFEGEMFHRRLARTLFGVPAWICTPEDVILHKLYWDTISPSERQRGDAVGVFAVQGDALDLAYLRRWAIELGVEPMLDAIVSRRLRPKAT